MTINNISGLVGNMLLGEMAKTNADLLQTFERLSTGRRINRASDDAAGLAIANRLEAQARGLAMAERNAQMGISYTQTAEGYLGSVTDDLQRIRELSVQAANGTLTDTDRAAIQQEVNALKENIGYTLDSAQFNSKPIFDGHTETFQIGAEASGNISLNIPSMTTASLNIDTIDVSTQAGAEAAMTQASSSMDSVLNVRTEFGATQNRLESALNSLAQTRIDTLSSLSMIQDANLAEEALNASQQMTILESQIIVAGQIKKLHGGLLPLLMD